MRLPADLRRRPALYKRRPETAPADPAPAGGRGYREFWPDYLALHRDPRNRALHYLGTIGAATALAVAILGRDWRLGALVPLIGYGPAWLGHSVFEHNRPASFAHPAWSLASDVRMLGLFLTGRLGGVLRGAGIAR